MISIEVERGYVSASVAAGLLGVSRQRVHQLLKAGRIPGAFLMDCGNKGEVWCIPRQQLTPQLTRRKKQ